MNMHMSYQCKQTATGDKLNGTAGMAYLIS